MIWVCGRVSLVFVEGKVIDFDFVDAVMFVVFGFVMDANTRLFATLF